MASEREAPISIEDPRVREIVLVAGIIANRAPAKQGNYVFASKIPWSVIHRLRRALDDAGIDWRP